jgi:uncharacterized protein (TIGR02246 family)
MDNREMEQTPTPESVQLLFELYVNDRNIEALVRLYEKNSVVIQKDGQFKQGERQIREHLEGLLSLKPKISNEVVQTLVVENIAMVFSNWQITGTLSNGEKIQASGQSFDVLSQQDDGTWLITIDSPYGNRPKIA